MDSASKDLTAPGHAESARLFVFRVSMLQGEIQQFSSRISILTEEKRELEERGRQEKVKAANSCADFSDKR